MLDLVDKKKLQPEEPAAEELSAGLATRKDAMLAKLQEISVAEGRLLVDGQWLTPAEARACHRRVRRKSWLIFFEISLVFVALFIVFALVLVLLKMFAID